MNRSLRLLFAAAVAAALSGPSVGMATPVVLVESGAAFPVSSARSALGAGGFLTLGGGKRFALTQRLSVALLGAGHASFFDNKCGSQAVRCSDDETATVLSVTGGPRLFLHDGHFELFFGARGGYYRGITSGRGGDAGGFALEAGFQYELVPGTSAGAFIRREEASLRFTNDKSDLQFLHVGLGFEHRFDPAPQAVSHPRYRPE